MRLEPFHQRLRLVVFLASLGVLGSHLVRAKAAEYSGSSNWPAWRGPSENSVSDLLKPYRKCVQVIRDRFIASREPQPTVSQSAKGS